MRRSKWLFTLLSLLVLVGVTLLALWWVGQQEFVDASQYWQGKGTSTAATVEEPVGQTFVAHHAGLQGIEFYLLPAGDAPQTLTLHLRANPQANQDLATATVDLPSEAKAGFYRFSFPVLDDSHRRYFYAFLEPASSTGNSDLISLTLVPGTSYQDGAAYQAHQPLDAQTTFQLVYGMDHVALDLVKAVLGWVGLLIVSGLLFILPGWAALAWFWPGRKLAWAEMMGLAAGVSLAIHTLLLVWTDLVGLHLGLLYAWLPAIVGGVALLWRYRTWRPRTGWRSLKGWAGSQAMWPDLALVFVLALVFGARMLVVRTLEVPMWGDSYQHTMVGQLFVDNGGLFNSWLPYVPLESFTYHFGFQAAAALNHWFTGQDMLHSVINVGQIMNVLAVLSLYPLAVKVARSRWAGVVAVVVAGMVSPMPMFYVNWGRYVQLAGQVILPAAIWLAWEALDSPERRIRVEVLAGLAAAGLILTHYRVTIYYVAFMPVLWVVATIRARKAKTSLLAPFLRVVVIGASALVLILPWVWRLFAGLLPTILGEFARAKPSEPTYHQAQVLNQTTRYVPLPLLVAALLGLVVGIVKRQGKILLLGVWIALWFLAANPNWVGLPGAVTVSNFEGVINNFTVLISLYIPVSILIGYLASAVIELLPEHNSWLRPAMALVLIALLALVGVKQSLTILDHSFALVTVPDTQAMDWIESNTPDSARFLANSFFGYEGNVVVGSDAGWWIPLLAHRENTVPPITYGHEATYDPNYVTQVNSFARTIEASNLDDPETVQFLKDNSITHVYIGQKGGNLSVDELLSSTAYELVYHRDRVWIFNVR